MAADLGEIEFTWQDPSLLSYEIQSVLSITVATLEYFN